ncbi:hypothetical protein NW849_09795 [Synechococcus sp. R55.3]|jgi:hypothetical protein
MWRDIIGLALAATLLLISKTAADTLGQSQVQTFTEPEPTPHSFPVE